MIRIENLTVQFGGVKPIDGLTVTLDKAIVGLIGPNGAGKTTLLNVLSGFVTPVSGSVAVNGVVISRAEAQHDVQRAIDYVGLGKRIHRKGSNLTTGERHLTEIAKALIGKPQLVMLDEPGAGMSESETQHLEAVIRGIPAYCGAQVFLIDHDVALIVACCEETMVLDFGKLLALGPTKDVLEQAEVRRAYLGDFEAMEAAA